MNASIASAFTCAALVWLVNYGGGAEAHQFVIERLIIVSSGSVIFNALSPC